MKKVLPEAQGSYRELNEIITGGIRERILVLGLELEIFRHLTEPVQAAAVAEAAGLNPLNTERFLDALATIGLVDKTQGRYRNQEQTQTFLVPSSPNYAGDMLLVYHSSVLALDKAVDLIKDGPSGAGPGEDITSEELWASWTEASASWVFGEVGPNHGRYRFRSARVRRF